MINLLVSILDVLGHFVNAVSFRFLLVHDVEVYEVSDLAGHGVAVLDLIEESPVDDPPHPFELLVYLLIELLAVYVHVVALDQPLSQSVKLRLPGEETALKSVSLPIQH